MEGEGNEEGPNPSPQSLGIQLPPVHFLDVFSDQLASLEQQYLQLKTEKISQESSQLLLVFQLEAEVKTLRNTLTIARTLLHRPHQITLEKQEFLEKAPHANNNHFHSTELFHNSQMVSSNHDYAINISNDSSTTTANIPQYYQQTEQINDQETMSSNQTGLTTSKDPFQKHNQDNDKYHLEAIQEQVSLEDSHTSTNLHQQHMMQQSCLPFDCCGCYCHTLPQAINPQKSKSKKVPLQEQQEKCSKSYYIIAEENVRLREKLSQSQEYCDSLEIMCRNSIHNNSQQLEQLTQLIADNAQLFSQTYDQRQQRHFPSYQEEQHLMHPPTQYEEEEYNQGRDLDNEFNDDKIYKQQEVNPAESPYFSEARGLSFQERKLLDEYTRVQENIANFSEQLTECKKHLIATQQELSSLKAENAQLRLLGRSPLKQPTNGQIFEHLQLPPSSDLSTPVLVYTQTSSSRSSGSANNSNSSANSIAAYMRKKYNLPKLKHDQS